MSFTLSIDTTSQYCSIAVLDRKKLLTEFNFVSSGELSETLISYIDNVFKSLKIGADDIELIGVATGPGQFTGIRVGLATLKGVFFNKDIPVVPLSSLDAIAAKLMNSEMEIVPVIDARRGEIYFASYRISDGDIIRNTSPALSKAEDLKKILGTDKNFCFTGTGTSVYKSLLMKDFPGSVFESRSPFIANEVGLISLIEFDAGNFLEGTDTLEPLYIRIPDAEKNFKTGKN